MFINNPYYVFVNSRDRISGTDENFTYGVNLPQELDFTHVVLLNANIPKSYYLVQKGAYENIFQLQENDTIVTITVPVGSYLLNSFKTVVGTLLTNASPNGLIYTLTYPSLSGPDTGKWTYTQSNGAIVSKIIINDHLYEPFGFLPKSVNVFNGTTLESTCVIKLQSEDRLLIHTNLVNNYRKDDILVSINSTSSINYSSITYTCPSPEFYARNLAGKQIGTATFSLSDEDGELIQLNNLNINLTLLFFKKDPIFEQIRSFLKMIVSK